MVGLSQDKDVRLRPHDHVEDDALLPTQRQIPEADIRIPSQTEWIEVMKDVMLDRTSAQRKKQPYRELDGHPVKKESPSRRECDTRHTSFAMLFNLKSPDDHLAACGLAYARDHVEKRCLASSVGTFDQVNPGAKRAAGVAYNAVLAITLANAAKFDGRHDHLTAATIESGIVRAT